MNNYSKHFLLTLKHLLVLINIYIVQSTVLLVLWININYSMLSVNLYDIESKNASEKKFIELKVELKYQQIY